MNDDKRLERIEEKVDTVLDRLASQESILAAQHESLKSHMRRTEILESVVVPMNKERYMVKGGIKLIAAILVTSAAIEGVVALLSYVHK